MSIKMEMKYNKDKKKVKDTSPHSQCNNLNELDYLRKVIDHVSDAVWSVDRSYRIRFLNATFKKRLKNAFGIDTKIGMKVVNYVSPELKTMWVKRYEKVFNGNKLVVEDSYHVENNYYYFEHSLVPVWQENEVIAVFIISKDITDKMAVLKEINGTIQPQSNIPENHQTDERVFQNQIWNYTNQLKAIHDAAVDLNTLILEPEKIYNSTLKHLRNAIEYDTGTVQLLNGNLLKVVGCFGFQYPESVLNLSFPLIEKFPNWKVVYDKKTVSLADAQIEYPHFHNESDTFSSGHIHSWLGVPLLFQNNIIGMIALDRNIVQPFTELEKQLVITFANTAAVAVHNAQFYMQKNKYEQKLIETNKQKEMLLKELHHRVKNNMQLVSSLLSLRSYDIREPKSLEILKELQTRIFSVASLHEKLYQSDNLEQIDLGEYSKSIIQQIINFYDSCAKIDFDISVEHICAPIDVSIPYGLFLGEVILNTIKHAFPNGRLGKVDVTLKKLQPEKIELRVKDNGIGLPDDLDYKNSKSMGMQLLNNLAQQLFADLYFQTQSGTECTLIFAVTQRKDYKYQGDIDKSTDERRFS